ncbi:hypothetical protein CCR75_000734 [Bremia lactucae]|uniref:HIT domain-containing protein n=1 Tax=Bremia lactucae TaxID=4779 RepID=A0A976FI39_BRELC|nr:hypothetical protein CCR75_000734 [Bremia lactucae]
MFSLTVTVISVSSGPFFRSGPSSSVKFKKECRFRQHAGGYIPLSHKTEFTTHEVEEVRRSEAAIMEISTSEDMIKFDFTNYSCSDTKETSTKYVKPSALLRKRSSSPYLSSSSICSSSLSSSTSSTSVSHKGVTYDQDGEMVHCRFCMILQSNTETFFHEDDDVVVFRPLNPVVESHILVVPRCHIRNINKLTPDDASLMRHMRVVAASILRDMPIAAKLEQIQGCTNLDEFESNLKFAFHSPPFNSIDHVHMHAFHARDGRFSCVGSIKYRRDTWWCRSLEKVMARCSRDGDKEKSYFRRRIPNARSFLSCGSDSDLWY